MEFDKHESAKWAQTVNQATDGYLEARETVLDESAARGFPVVTGEGLSQLLAAGFKVKQKLTEANGKLYEEERSRIFEIIEFEMKLAVQVAKLAMQLYREQLLNEVSIEQTEEEARKELQRADIERLNAETEQRQVAIINAKAAAEHEVNGYRLQLVEAERATLGADLLLVKAQLATAQARLAIIDSIYEVIAAEALVLAAEKRKAAALELVIAAEAEVAAVKESMIPGYIAKANAKKVLATATTQDAENRKQIEALGFQRNALKASEAGAESTIRQAELTYAVAQDALARATDAVEVARATSRTTVQTAHNAAKEASISIRQGAEITRASLRWQAELTHTLNRITASIMQSDGHAGIVRAELASLLASIQSVGISEEAEVRASATQVITTERASQTYEHIQKGA